MNTYNKIILLFTFGFLTQVNAQSNLLNAKTPNEIGKKTAAQLNLDNDRPMEYGYVHDRDVMYGRNVWEIIDLDERVNFPLYFPIDTNNIGKDRRSLFDVLAKSIESGKITEVYGDSYFASKRTLKEIESIRKRVDTTNQGRMKLNAGEALAQEDIVTYFVEADQVMDYKVRGFWYFDKRQGDLRYRMLGICPVTPDVYTLDKDEKDYVELFWVYYPAAREVLNEWKVFNNKNTAMSMSFDHLLNARRFSSTIYKEENVMGDREVKEYMNDNALNQLLESERVKDRIRSFEQDMWNY
jgi:gliding motility associated protien GldN